MSTTHVYFADLPLAAVSQEGHSTLNGINDDAIRQCRSISPNCSTSPLPRYEHNMGFFRQLSRRFGLRSNDDLVFTSSNEDDNRSSSTDSCSSHTPATAANAKSLAGDNNKKGNNLLLTSAQANEYISCASSETSSTVDIEEQLQQLQLQHEQQQQQQQHIGNVNNDDDDSNNLDDDVTAADNNENSNDVLEPAYNKERKSFARSSFSRLHRRSTSSLRRAFEAFSLSSRSLSCSGVTPPPILPTSSLSSSTTNGTPIKSALKSSSNLELNKKSQNSFVTTNSCLKKSLCLASGKSSSISSSATSSKTKTKPPPQRILRQPVSYTYLKGISGLPTQRVPRNSVCCQYARH